MNFNNASETFSKAHIKKLLRIEGVFLYGLLNNGINTALC